MIVTTMHHSYWNYVFYRKQWKKRSKMHNFCIKQSFIKSNSTFGQSLKMDKYSTFYLLEMWSLVWYVASITYNFFLGEVITHKNIPIFLCSFLPFELSWKIRLFLFIKIFRTRYWNIILQCYSWTVLWCFVWRCYQNVKL